MSKLLSHYATNRTKLVSVDRSSPAIPVSAQEILLCSAKAEQRPKQRQSKPTDLLPHKKTFSIFQFPFASVRRMPSKARSIDQGSEESIVQCANGQVRSLSELPFPPSFSTGPDVDGPATGSPCIVATGHDRRANARASFALRFK